MAFVDVIVAAFAVGADAGAIAAGVAAVGTDIEVVGAVTGNRTMMEVGGVMSLAGGAVGLAAGAIGGGTDAATAVATNSDAAYSAQSDAAMLGANGGGAVPVPTPDPVPAVTQSALGASDITSATPTADASGAYNAGADSQAANAAMSGGQAPSANDIGGTQTGVGTAQSNAPGASGASTSGADTSNAYNAAKDSQSYNAMLPNGGAAPAPPADTSPFGIKTWYNSLTPQAQAAVINTAGQGVAGMVGGLFNGWTQQQKLALAQQQQNLVQTQYTNAMNNASAQPGVGASYKQAQAPAPAQPMAAAPAAPTGLLNNIKQSNV